MRRSNWDSKYLIHGLGWLLIGVHFFIYSSFFPNSQGKLGHDYSYNLPLLLDGYYWFVNNGLFAVPWHTPAFCGGMPLVANPATFYYSVAQFLTFLTDPLTSVRLTFLLFAALGYWGFYRLLRGVFSTSRWSALLGGTLFLFNGLYTYRFIIGHMEFHAFMLAPFLAYFLLRGSTPPGPWRSWAEGKAVVVSGLLLSYMFMSGMTQLIVPSLIGILLFALVHKLRAGESFSFPRFGSRLAAAGLLSLGLSAAKLVAALSFLGNFPRDSYLLPGVEGVGKLLFFIAWVLAFGGGQVDSDGLLANVQWPLSQHEFEYGLTVVPFLLLAGLVGRRLGGVGRLWGRLRQASTLLTLTAILLLLAIPVGLNYYSPAWNQVLKATPFIKNLSNFLRWLNIYILFVILLTALAVEAMARLQRFRPAAVGCCLLLIVAQNLLAGKEFYDTQNYDPTTVVAAYRRVRESGVAPVLSELTAPLDPAGKPVLSFSRNDALANGQSQLLCYEPMFGFRLELFPFKSLVQGPMLYELGNVLNVKNPACYLYPQENQCTPGDHFRTPQKGEAEKFIAYRPFDFQVSTPQKIANAINGAALLLVVGFAGAGLARGWRGRPSWLGGRRLPPEA